MTAPGGDGAAPGEDSVPPGDSSPSPAEPSVAVRPARAARSKFTGRAAVLAVVICAVALSLAYPVRSYIAERRQISQLEQLNAQLAEQASQLRSQARTDTTPAWIEQQARDQLHMCFPSQTCYVVVGPSRQRARGGAAQPGTSWYMALWKSVQEAGKKPGT